MKKTVFVFLSLFFLFPGLSGAGQNFSVKKSEGPFEIHPPLKTLVPGEKFSYEVFWMGIPVGLGTLEVKEKTVVRGRPAFHVIAVAETNDFLSKIYPVRDEIHSYIDAERFYSLEFRKVLSEGRYRADERVIYDHEKKKGYYESFKNDGKKEFEIPGGIQDFLSAFYWFRLQPVEIGRSVRTVVNDEKDNWDLEVRCLGHEKKSLNKREDIDALVVEPRTRLKGMLYDRGRVWVYFSRNAERVPVWFKVSTPFGPVVAVLRQGN